MIKAWISRPIHIQSPLQKEKIKTKVIPRSNGKISYWSTLTEYFDNKKRSDKETGLDQLTVKSQTAK